jgi:HYR domain
VSRLLALASSIALAAVLAPSSGATLAGSLALSASFAFKWGQPATCPAGVDPSVSSCLPQTAQTLVRGLGAVSVSNLAVITEKPVGSGCWLWSVTGTLSVAGKGDISFAAIDPGCQQQSTANLTYAITAGTGRYAGASGSGTFGIPAFVEATLTGLQAWTGTLDVSGLEFDTVPPVLRGAVGKTVRTKNRKGAVVRYAVTAKDAVDGSVAAICKPRSGSRFKVGKTIVKCTAADTSGNVATAAFKVTVKR